ncbi:hypothetical protein PVL29_014773 [Vitis rotundifolia]|uniref:Uncharacterized protein n=1 Tax=Vitis rotundifolia TaxID=103349 RepID=A0AA38ZJ02_VITRO|nr:hypothetical protein PVL29_014773 [Vitis rotundifolia]
MCLKYPVITRTLRKFNFRGVDLDALLSMCTNELAKYEAPPDEKSEPVKTHLRNTIIVLGIIGSIIRLKMIGHYLAKFSISYKPVKHGRLGIGATHSSRFIHLK